jgi:hypothetical protein
LYNFSFAVDQNERVVGVLFRMLLVLFARQTENAPNTNFFAHFTVQVLGGEKIQNE